jgi:hypothetical protein
MLPNLFLRVAAAPTPETPPDSPSAPRTPPPRENDRDVAQKYLDELGREKSKPGLDVIKAFLEAIKRNKATDLQPHMNTYKFQSEMRKYQEKLTHELTTIFVEANYNGWDALARASKWIQECARDDDGEFVFVRNLMSVLPPQ